MATTKEELGIIVKLTDQASAGAGKIASSLGNLGHAAGAVEKSFGKLRGASQRLNAVFQGIGIGVGIGSFYAVERAIGSVIRIIPDLIGRGEQWAKTVDDIADKTGVTAEQASKLAVAAQYVNVSTDSLTLGLVRLSRYVIDNEQRFTKFGIATRDANGALLSAYDIFQNIRSAISGTGAAMLSTAAAQDLLGRGGADLADLLQLTDAQFNAISADAQLSGLIMTDAARQAAEEWERTKTRLSATVTGLGTQILGGIAPYLSLLVDSIANAIQQNMDKIVQFAVSVVNFLGGLVAGLFGLTLPTISFADALGKVGGRANGAADGLSHLNEQANNTATGEDRLTKSLNRQIAAIDQQLKLMGRRDQAQNASEQRQQILDDLATARQQLADVQGETIFAAGMTNAELVLAQQKQADDIIDAQKNISDVRQRLADHDRQEQQRQRRQQLEDERAALQKRLAAHRKFVADIQKIYKPIISRPQGQGFTPGFLGDNAEPKGTPASGLTAAITQAAADARAAGAQMAQDVRDFLTGVRTFVTWAGGIIDALNKNIPGTNISFLTAGIGVVLLRALGGGSLVSAIVGGITSALGLGGAAAAGGGGVALVPALVAAFSGWLGLKTLGDFLPGGDKSPINPPLGPPAWAQPGWHPTTPTAWSGAPDAKDHYLQSIAQSLTPGGSFFQQHYDGVSAAQDSASNTANTADNTANTADRTQGLTDKLAGGIDTSVINSPTVNAATGFTVDVGNQPSVTVPGGVGVTNKSGDGGLIDRLTNGVPVTTMPTVKTNTNITNTTGDGGLLDKLGTIQTKVGAVVGNTYPSAQVRFASTGQLSTTTAVGTSPGGCFLYGTLVETPDGPKPIELIEIGDYVLSVNTKTMQVEPQQVWAVHRHPAHRERRVIVSLADGRHFESTATHPVYDADSGTFRPASEIGGRTMWDAEGIVSVVSVREVGDEPTDVCDISVTVRHNYLIAGGLLVHNVGTKNNTAANGLLGMTNMATDVTFGEAGREAVAILRNPRPMPNGGVVSGGPRPQPSGPVQITLMVGADVLGRIVTNWQDLHASRSTTLRLPGGSF